MRVSSIRSSIVLARVGFGDHPFRHSVDDIGVVLVGQRLGEHGKGADGRLQFMTDVGDEVGAHGIARLRSLTSSIVATAEPRGALRRSRRRRLSGPLARAARGERRPARASRNAACTASSMTKPVCVPATALALALR